MINVTAVSEHTFPLQREAVGSIDFNEDPSLPRRAVRVTLDLNDGRTYTENVEHPTGTPPYAFAGERSLQLARDRDGTAEECGAAGEQRRQCKCAANTSHFMSPNASSAFATCPQ